MTTYEIIDAQAKESAAELLAQGWNPSEYGYDLGAYLGDLQALEDRLNRRATQDERYDLERMIRDYLTCGR